MGSGSGKELESEDTNTETQGASGESTSQQTDKSQKSEINKAPPTSKQIEQIQAVKSGSLSESDDIDEIKNNDNDNKRKIKHNKSRSFAEVKEEDIADLNYIKPDSEEINNSNDLFLIHIGHRGHYNQDSKWSAQNLLEDNDSKYMSLKAYNFDSKYNKCDHDWIIFKIDSLNLIKITQLMIEYSTTNNIEQYPFKICLQFMLTNNLKSVIISADDDTKWTKPYYVKPSIFESKKPKIKGIKHNDEFIISLAAEYLDDLYNNKYDQYVRISFIESHGNNNYDNYDNKESKYCLTNLKLFGVPLLDDNNNLIDLEINNDKNQKQYKYEIENKYSSNLQPKPGKNDARILMREHIFFVNVGNKTINILKNTICDEYDRLNRGNSNNNNKYNAKRIILVLDGYGFINDMMDNTVLNKTLSQIGAKNGNNNTGYYITVGFC